MLEMLKTGQAMEYRMRKATQNDGYNKAKTETKYVNVDILDKQFHDFKDDTTQTLTDINEKLRKFRDFMLSIDEGMDVKIGKIFD
jgi:hypothetical protein